MTALTTPLAPASALPLRRLVQAEVLLNAPAGLLAVAAPGPLAELLGPDVSPTAVRVVGVALLVWALDAALLARTSGRVLRTTVLVAALANLAWEVATVVLVVLGAFSTAGAVLALAVAAVVGGLGLVQLRALRR
jgi:hypothetical protein